MPTMYELTDKWEREEREVRRPAPARPNEWPHGAILEGRDGDGAVMFVAWTPTEAAAGPVWDWLQDGAPFEHVCMRPAEATDVPDLDRYWETKG